MTRRFFPTRTPQKIPGQSVSLGVTLTKDEPPPVVVAAPPPPPSCECIADSVTWLVLPLKTIGVNFNRFNYPDFLSSTIAQDGFLTDVVVRYPYNEHLLFVGIASGDAPSVTWDVEWSGPNAEWPEITTDVTGSHVFVRIVPTFDSWQFSDATLTATASCGSTTVGVLTLELQGDQYGYY